MRTKTWPRQLAVLLIIPSALYFSGGCSCDDKGDRKPPGVDDIDYNQNDDDDYLTPPDDDDDDQPCVDMDGDDHFAVAPDSCPAGDDNCDDDPDNWTVSGCAGCADRDGDDFRAGCDFDSDCDDDPITGQFCHQDCGTFFADLDDDGYGDPALQVTACLQPDGYVTDNTDCDPSDPAHWSPIDCEFCSDDDGDGYGNNCDLGADCDDLSPVAADCHADCEYFFGDADLDGHGDLYSFLAACTIYPGAVTNYDDCDPINPAHWSDCGVCADGDGDGYGPGCDLGDDCDEDLTTGATCHDACGTFFLDNDGDGWGGDSASYIGCVAPLGYAPTDTDCDDSAATGVACHLGCATYYADADGDGYGNVLAYQDACTTPAGYVIDAGDCAPTDSAHWRDCGSCLDADNDDYGAGCDLGSDCDDTVATGMSCHTGCSVYFADADADGYGDPASPRTACVQPAGYLTNDADCDPTNSDHWSDCGVCTDADLDGHGALCDLGADCDDADIDNWASCATCVDVDGDGYSLLCDAYSNHDGPDCNDADIDNWLSCASCVDNDTDTYYFGCDAYATRQGPDCGDGDVNNWDKCATCLDADEDASYANCNTYTTILGPDCAPDDNAHWSDCGLCGDIDGDDYGAACDLGTDCDEADPSVHSGMVEIPEDGVDQDCSGADLIAADDNGIYVDVNDLSCQNSSPGTMTNPNCSIQAAINLAAAGADIFVAEGDYGRISVSKKVQLYGGYNTAELWTRGGAGLSRIVVSGNWDAPGVLITASGSLVMDNFSVIGAAVQRQDLDSAIENNGLAIMNKININAKGTYYDCLCNFFSGILNHGVLIFVSGAVSVDARETSSSVEGIFNYDGKLFLVNSIIRSLFCDSSNDGIYNSWETAQGKGRAVLVNNRIYGGVAPGPTAGVFSRYGNNIVINNTIDGGFGVLSSIGMTGNGWWRLFNSSLWGAQQDCRIGICLNDLGVINSCSWSHCLGSSGNLGLDPQYVNPAAGDFHLAAGSPMIDAGIDPSPYVDYRARPWVYSDFEGNLRPQDGDSDGNSAWDIGPDESVP